MSRSQEASSPIRSMAQSDEAAATPAAASTLTLEKASIITRSSTSASAAADQQSTGDVLATVADARVVVAVTAGATATTGAEAAVADAVVATKENANKKTGKDAGRGGMDENTSGKTETLVSSDRSAANNLRERSGEEENIWVSAVDNGDAVRHRASGRYRRGVQHRPSARGGEAALGNQVPAPSSGLSAEASGGVIAAAVAARARVEAAKAAAAVPAPAGKGPHVVTAEPKKARKRGKSVSRTVARIFGRSERTVTVTRGGGVG